MRTLAVAFLISLSTAAFAGTITDFDPRFITTRSGDHVLSITGTDLGTVVRFAGPAGTFEVGSSTGGGSLVQVAVPQEVANTAGLHEVIVLGGPSGDSQPVYLQVDDETNFPLTIAPSDPIVVRATSREGALVEFTVSVYGGRDPNPNVSCSPASGSLFPLGQTNVFCVATNSFGERDDGGVYIYVQDSGVPQLTLPDDITVHEDDQGGAVVTYETSATDDVDGSRPVSCSHPSGSRFPVGVTTVQCTATDSSNNVASGSFTVKVTSDEPEVLMIHVPDPITAEADSAAGTGIGFTVTADGTSDPNPSITCNPAPGEMFPLGTTTVNCVARDSFGNTASGELTITIVDTRPPVLLLPEPIVVPSDGNGGAVVEYQASASDAVDGDLPATCAPASGSRFPVGETEVQCSATDSRSNTATGTFTVTVREDQGTLMIHVPDPITVEAESAGGAVVQFTVTADGTADPDPDISCNPASGSTFALGTTKVECVATDQFGNAANGSFDVTVVDTIAPVIAGITATPDNLGPPNHKMVPVTISVDVSDVADPMPRCFVFSVTANEDISGDYEFKSDLEIELRSERQKEDRRYEVHVRCVDDSANATDGSVIVTVPKGADEAISAPAPAPKKPFRKWW